MLSLILIICYIFYLNYNNYINTPSKKRTVKQYFTDTIRFHVFIQILFKN